MARAAIFDLDRTLISGSSAEVFGAKLADVGVEIPKLPGQTALLKLFERFGEDPLSMRLARQSARLFAGRRVDDVRAAALVSAELLMRELLPHALAEIEHHKLNGTQLVLATTSPSDLVEPFGAALGFDHTIATRYRSTHGIYDGTIDGEYLWHDHKAAAVAEWAASRCIDLSESWAYSDSWYDLPLLESVGHPVAVNPDVRLRSAAVLRRWAVRNFERPPGVVSVGGVEAQDLLFPFLDPRLSIFAKIEVLGLDNLPRSGPVIMAANHRSSFDPIAIAYIARAASRPLRFVANTEVVDIPVIGAAISSLGMIAVDLVSESTAPLDAAARVLAGGEAVVVLPHRAIPRDEELSEAGRHGRTGAVRLAQRTGAPLVPIGLWGTEHVWPRDQRLPTVRVRGDRPTVTITIGAPYTVTKWSKPQPATEKLMKKIQLLLPDEDEKYRPR